MTATIHPIHRPRTMEQILGEIRIADDELQRLRQVAFAGGLTDAQDARWSVLEDKILAGKTEARKMVRDTFDVSWSVISSYLD